MKSKKRILILGANSYIAKQFVLKYSKIFTIKSVKRDDSFRNYFDIKQEIFINIDVVINFTAIVHKKGIERQTYFEVNKKLALLFASYAKKAGVKHFLQLSTIAVYGDRLEKISINTQEEPVSAYGKSKLEADHQLLTMQNNNFCISIIRPPLVYGKDAPGNMHLLIKLIKTNLPLPFQNFENKRSFIFTDNLLNALSLTIEKEVGGVLLFKDKEDISMGELSYTLKKNLESKNIFFPMPINLFSKYINRIGVLRKLYGTLIIDDASSQKKIGNYALVDFQNAVSKMTKEENI